MVATSDTAVSFSAFKAFNNRAIALDPAKMRFRSLGRSPMASHLLVPTHVEEAGVVGVPTVLLRGRVTASVVVRKDGSVQVIGRPVGPLSLTDGHRAPFGNVIDAVAYAVSKSRFEPYVVDGQTVEVATSLVYVFDGKPFQGLVDMSAPHPKDDVAAPAPGAKK